MTSRATLILLLALTYAYPTDAKIHEKLDINALAKDTSDIVVVTEGDSIDGELTVLETLKGELKPGDNLSIPELGVFSSREARAIGDLVSPRPDDVLPETKYVTCSRMILFLKRNPAIIRGTHRAVAGELPLWMGIGDLSICQSIFWIEEGRTYGFYDVISFNGRLNNDRGILADYDYSEAEIKNRIRLAVEKGK